MADAAKTEEKKEEAPKPFAGFSFTVGDTPNPFLAGGAIPTFGAPAAPKDGDEDAGEADPEKEDPSLKFEPQVDLAALPEVKPVTNEEDEEATFKDRAKMFRFAKPDKNAEEGSKGEWKERGTGDIKILKHKTSGKYRVVMRREKTHKICCNHALTAELTLKQNSGSDRSWTWAANDFSEGEMKPEVFAIRFSTPEVAERFKKLFEEGQAENKKLATPTK